VGTPQFTKKGGTLGGEYSATGIEIEDLALAYGSKPALSGFTCSFGSGITGILGPNGAGKSTLFKALTGTMRPRSGTIRRDGTLLRGHKAWQRHLSHLGYLPQDPNWFGGFTVMELCVYVAGLRGLDGRSSVGAAKRAVASVGLTGHAGDRLGSLSGGMRRRAFIAQAIVHDPPILILDEPTSGLDPVQRMHLRELLAAMGQSRTVILSTHLVEDVARLAQQILVLDNGRLAWQGDPVALTRRAARRSADPELASLYERGFMALLSESDDT